MRKATVILLVALIFFVCGCNRNKTVDQSAKLDRCLLSDDLVCAERILTDWVATLDDTNPDKVQMLANLGSIRMSLLKYDQAEAAAREIIAKHFNDKPQVYRAFLILAQRTLRTRSITYPQQFEGIISATPKSETAREALIGMSEEALRRDNIDQALEICEKTIPEHGGDKSQVLRCFLQADRWFDSVGDQENREKALKRAQTVIHDGDLIDRLRLAQVRFATKAGRFDEAKAILADWTPQSENGKSELAAARLWAFFFGMPTDENTILQSLHMIADDELKTGTIPVLVHAISNGVGDAGTKWESEIRNLSHRIKSHTAIARITLAGEHLRIMFGDSAAKEQAVRGIEKILKQSYQPDVLEYALALYSTYPPLPRLEEALDRVEAVGERFKSDPFLASQALLAQGMLQSQSDNPQAAIETLRSFKTKWRYYYGHVLNRKGHYSISKYYGPLLAQLTLFLLQDKTSAYEETLSRTNDLPYDAWKIGVDSSKKTHLNKNPH